MYVKEYSLEKGQSELAGQGNLEASLHIIEIGTKCKSCTLKTDILCFAFITLTRLFNILPIIRL